MHIALSYLIHTFVIQCLKLGSNNLILCMMNLVLARSESEFCGIFSVSVVSFHFLFKTVLKYCDLRGHNYKMIVRKLCNVYRLKCFNILVLNEDILLL